MTRVVVLSTLALAGLTSLAQADVKPHALFTDGAVLQRGKPVPIFGSAAPGEEVTVTFAGHKATAKTDETGRWLATLPALEASSKPAPLTLAGKNTVTVKNVVVGEVWICSGQSNMEWSMAQSYQPQKAVAESADPLLRLFKVPHTPYAEPVRDVNATWASAAPNTTPKFSAVAYYFGRNLRKSLDVPIGLIETCWGGTICEAWTSREALSAVPRLKGLADRAPNPAGYSKAADQYLIDLEKYLATARKLRADGKDLPTPPPFPSKLMNQPNIPTVLYNGMIAPLLPTAIAGAIWYQGESNASRAEEYRTLLPTMIQDWRTRFGVGEFPFLIVQLAPFMKISAEPQESNWAALREAQSLATTKLPKVALAVITDVGEQFDIHPPKKEPVGDRLALAARALEYGEKIVFSGPVFKSMAVKDGKAVLTFEHIGKGLEAKDGALKGFAICGPDKKFVNAEATIEGDSVIVNSPNVKEPTAVRYGWADFPVVNLWNKDGLPADPFRTDRPKE